MGQPTAKRFRALFRRGRIALAGVAEARPDLVGRRHPLVIRYKR